MKIWAGVFDELYLSFCKAIYDISYTRWDNSKEDKHIILIGNILTINEYHVYFHICIHIPCCIKQNAVKLLIQIGH